MTEPVTHDHPHVQYWLDRGGLSTLRKIHEAADEMSLDSLVFKEAIWEAPNESIITVGEPGDRSWERKPIAMSLPTERAETVAEWLESTDLVSFVTDHTDTDD